MDFYLQALMASIVIALVILILMPVLGRWKGWILERMGNLTAITVGALLALVFMEFIPETVAGIDVSHVGVAMLSGILLFYILEVFLHWHHCSDLGNKEHRHECEMKHKNSHHLMMLGTFLHNFWHGLILYSAFSLSTEVGIVFFVAILAHSLPQNVANIIMNYEKVRSVIIAAVGTVLGVLVCYPLGSLVLNYRFYILAVLAGGILYLSLSDLLPLATEGAPVRRKIVILLWVILGIALIYGVNVVLKT